MQNVCLHLCIFPPPLAVSNERRISEAVYNPISLTEVSLDPTQAWSKGPVNASDPAIYAPDSILSMVNIATKNKHERTSIITTLITEWNNSFMTRDMFS